MVGSTFLVGKSNTQSDFIGFLYLGTLFFGVGLWLFVCMAYANSKAQPAPFGLVSFLELIGLVMLAALPDTSKKSLDLQAKGDAPPHLTNSPR